MGVASLNGGARGRWGQKYSTASIVVSLFERTALPVGMKSSSDPSGGDEELTRTVRWGCRVQATLPVRNRRAASVMRSKSYAPLADRCLVHGLPPHRPMMKSAGDDQEQASAAPHTRQQSLGTEILPNLTTEGKRPHRHEDLPKTSRWAGCARGKIAATQIPSHRVLLYTDTLPYFFLSFSRTGDRRPSIGAAERGERTPRGP